MRRYYKLGGALDAEAREKWLLVEHERLRAVRQRARARRRAQRNGEPDYPELVLASMTRWIDAHRLSSADIDLAEAVHAMRKSARLEGLNEELWDRIQEKGSAKFLRSMGFELVRQAQGMVVLGLRGG